MVAHSLEATAVNRRLCLESALQYLLYVPKKYAIKNFRNILNTRTLTSYFCKDIVNGIVGIAYLGSACRSDGFSVNINELYTNSNTELRTAKVFAHELGHNLGME